MKILEIDKLISINGGMIKHAAATLGADTSFDKKTAVNDLYKAVELENLEKIKELLESGVDINTKNENGETSLHIFAKNIPRDISEEDTIKKLKVLDLLLEYDIKVEMRNKDNKIAYNLVKDKNKVIKTTLFITMYNSEKRVHEKNGEKEFRDPVYDTKALPVDTYILKCGHIFKKSTIDQLRNQICPYCRGSLDGKEELKINVDILNTIVKSNCEKLINLFFHKDIDNNTDKLLLESVKLGKVYLFKYLLEEGANINIKNEEGEDFYDIGNDEIKKIIIDKKNIYDYITKILVNNFGYQGEKINNFNDLLELSELEKKQLLAKNIELGNKIVIDLLLKTAVDINTKDINGQTALHYAAKSKNYNLAIKLLKRGVNYLLKDNSSKLASEYAEGKTKEVFKKLKSAIDIERVYRGHIGRQIVRDIHDQKYYRVIEKLLGKEEKNILQLKDLSKEDLGEAFVALCKKTEFDEELAHFLLDKNADINKKYNYYIDNKKYHIIPAEIAFSCGNMKMIKLLIKKGINKKKYYKTQQIILDDAAISGDLDIIEEAIEAGIEFSKNIYLTDVGLYRAAEYGHLPIVYKLLEYGAKCYIDGFYNLYGKSSKSDKVPFNGNLEVFKLIIKKHLEEFDFDSLDILDKLNVKRPVILSLKSEDSRMLRVIFDMRRKYRIKILYKEILIDAVDFGNIEAVNFLINKGVELDVADNSGNTALHKAVENDYLEITQILLKAGADVNGKGINKRSPIFYAISSNNVEMAALLLKYGANPNDETETRERLDSTTLLYEAAYFGNAEMVNLLIENGADVNKLNGTPRTPEEKIKFRSHLPEMGVPFGMRIYPEWNKIYYNYKSERTPLAIAARTGNCKLVRLLLDLGANPFIRDIKDRKIIIRGNKEIKKVFIGYFGEITYQFFEYEDYTEKYIPNPNYMRERSETYCEFYDRTHKSTILSINDSIYLKKEWEIEKLLNDGTDVNETIVENFFCGTSTTTLTMLYRACEVNAEGIVRLLLKRGANVNLPKKIIERNVKLLRQRRKKEEEVRVMNSSALHIAAENGNIKIIEELCKYGAELDMKDYNGETPLITAIKKKKIAAAQILINREADVSVCDKEGNSVLHLVSKYGHIELLKKIIGKGLDINAKNNHGETPLHMVSRSCVEMAKELMINGAKINIQDNRGWTPLHRASYRGNSKLVQILFDNGANPFIKNNNDKKARYYSCLDVKTLFTNIEASMNIQRIFRGYTGREEAKEFPNQTYYREIEKLFELSENSIKKKADIDRKIKNIVYKEKERIKDLALIIISDKKEKVELLKFLLDMGANIDMLDWNKQSPLHIAVDGNNLEGVKELIKRGADVNKVIPCFASITSTTKSFFGGSGISPLHIASACGYEEIAELLICNGANVNAGGKFTRRMGEMSIDREIDNMTPLHLSIKAGSFNITRLLLKNKDVDVNKIDEYGDTPLHYFMKVRFIKKNMEIYDITKGERIELLRLFLEKKGDPFMKGEHNKTPIDRAETFIRYAAEYIKKEIYKWNSSIVIQKIYRGYKARGENKYYRAVEVLLCLEKNSILRYKDLNEKMKSKLLEKIIKTNKKSLLRFLGKKGINLDTIKVFGNKLPALHYVAMKENLKILKELIKAGADVNVELERTRENPLYYAARYGHKKIAKELIKNGAHIRWGFGENNEYALHYAVKMNHTNAVKIFVELGVNIDECENKEKETPLHIAVKSGSNYMVELLIRLGADINKPNREGKLPLELVPKNEYCKAKILLEYGSYTEGLKSCARIVSENPLIDQEISNYNSIVFRRFFTIYRPRKSERRPDDFICHHIEEKYNIM